MKNSAVMLIVLALLGCNQNKQPVEMPPQQITVVEVIQKNVPIYNEFVGQIYGLKDIPIRARVDGVLERVAFDEGTRVNKGDLLYIIDEDPYLAEVAAQESRLAEAQTNMVNAKNELERYKPLAEIDAVSKSDLDAAQASYDASKAAVRAAESNVEQARIRLSYCTITAPIDGLIGATQAREGEYVGKEPNPVILNTVSRIDTVRVQFSISENRYLELAKAYRQDKNDEDIQKEVDEGTVQPNIELILADGSLYEEKGKVDFVNSQINSTTGSLLIQASFPNPSRILRPGLYAKVRLQLTEVENALIIPQRCLIELQGKYSVLVVGDENKVSSQPITILSNIGDQVVISEGLSKGDKVVIDAIQKVRPGAEVVPEIIEFKSKTNE
jgi:membrane fusion protein (multidrug efflux system)